QSSDVTNDDAKAMTWSWMPWTEDILGKTSSCLVKTEYTDCFPENQVQVPEDDLDNLQAESEEGTLELEDPRELLGSILLETFLDLGFLEYTN
nr:hypothetical protein [Tanacetum cinerariifolium]